MALLGKFLGALRSAAKSVVSIWKSPSVDRGDKEDDIGSVKEQMQEQNEDISEAKKPCRPPVGCIKKAALIEYNGEKKTAQEWAAIMGVSKNAINRRLRKYGTIKPPDSENKPVAQFEDIRLINTDSGISIEADGNTYTLFQFAKQYGINFSTLYGRIQKGMDIHDAIKIPRTVNRDYSKYPPVKAKVWEWNGEKHTVEEWAKIFGVKKGMMRRRLTEHGSPEKNTDRKDAYNKRRSRQFEWKGEVHTVKEWAQIYKVPERTMFGRLKKYNSPEHVDNAFIKPVGKIWEWNGEKHTAVEWAKITGLAERTVRRNLAKYGSPYSEFKKQREEKHQKATKREKSVSIIEKKAEDSSDDLLYWSDGECKSIAEWAKEYGLSERTVKNNFNEYGAPVKPEYDYVDFVEEDDDCGEREEDIDEILRDVDRKITESAKNRESIHEWLERIHNEPDDGRPLKEILCGPLAR